MSWAIAVQASFGSLSLDVTIERRRDPTVIVGPNGAGKTSLLRLVAGAYRPLSGALTIGGKAIFDSQKKLDLPPEERRVGYVPQGFCLFPHLRVVDNVAFGQSVGKRRKSVATRREAAMALLEELDCAHLANRFPKRLSGGEQQRVALARALLVEPALLLLDEPLSTLDPSSRRRLRTFLADHLASRQTPAIVVTHDPRDVEALGADVIVLENGRVTQRGSAKELRSAPATEFVAEFFGESP